MHEFLEILAMVVVIFFGMAAAAFLYFVWRASKTRDLGWDRDDYDSGCAP